MKSLMTTLLLFINNCRRGHGGHPSSSSNHLLAPSHSLQQCQPCFFCGRGAPQSISLLTDPTVQTLSEVCPTHASLFAHRLCMLWSLSAVTTTVSVPCFICEYLIIRVRSSASRRFGPLIAVINGLRLSPGSPMLPECRSLLTTDEHSIWKRLKTQREYWLEYANFICDRKIVLRVLREVECHSHKMPKQGRYTQNMLSVSQLTDREIYQEVTSRSVSNNIIESTHFRFTLPFYYQLTTSEVLELTVKLIPIKFFHYKRSDKYYLQFFDSFFRAGFTRLPSDSVLVLFKYIFNHNMLKLLCAVTECCKIYHVVLPPELVLDLIDIVLNSLSSATIETKLGLLVPIICLLPDWSGQEDALTRLEKLGKQKNSILKKFLFQYICEYSKIPHEIRQESGQSVPEIESFLTKELVESLAYRPISLRFLRLHFHCMKERKFSPEVFVRAIETVRDMNRLSLHSRFVLAIYLQYDNFWRIALKMLTELVADKQESHRAHRLLGVLMGGERCTPKVACDILSIAMGSEHDLLFCYCARIICNRVDFHQFPEESLLKFLRLAKLKGDRSLLMEILLNFPWQRTDLLGFPLGQSPCPERRHPDKPMIELDGEEIEPFTPECDFIDRQSIDTLVSIYIRPPNSGDSYFSDIANLLGTT